MLAPGQLVPAELPALSTGGRLHPNIRTMLSKEKIKGGGGNPSPMSHIQLLLIQSDLRGTCLPEINNPCNMVVFTMGLRELVLLSACLPYHADLLKQCFLYPVSDPFLFSDLLL